MQKEVGKNNNDITLVLPYTVSNLEYYEKYYDNIIIPESVETVGAVLFQECIHVNIYVKQESMPIGWNSSWNHLDFPVVWGYAGS